VVVVVVVVIVILVVVVVIVILVVVDHCRDALLAYAIMIAAVPPAVAPQLL